MQTWPNSSTRQIYMAQEWYRWLREPFERVQMSFEIRSKIKIGISIKRGQYWRRLVQHGISTTLITPHNILLCILNHWTTQRRRMYFSCKIDLYYRRDVLVVLVTQISKHHVILLSAKCCWCTKVIYTKFMSAVEAGRYWEFDKQYTVFKASI